MSFPEKHIPQISSQLYRRGPDLSQPLFIGDSGAEFVQQFSQPAVVVKMQTTRLRGANTLLTVWFPLVRIHNTLNWFNIKPSRNDYVCHIKKIDNFLEYNEIRIRKSSSEMNVFSRRFRCFDEAILTSAETFHAESIGFKSVKVKSLFHNPTILTSLPWYLKNSIIYVVEITTPSFRLTPSWLIGISYHSTVQK